MRAYHRTHQAPAILRDGFKDGYYMVPGIGELHGVPVSADWPLNENEGADGDAVIELWVPEAVFREYECVTDDSTYREAMIPAAELKRFPRRLVADDEIDPLTRALLTKTRFADRLGQQWPPLQP